MISFKGKEKKLHEYIEMGVKFGVEQEGDPFESMSEFVDALYPFQKIRSSSAVNYDDQKAEWQAFAAKHQYDGLKELANAIVKLEGFKNEKTGFPGIEGLAVLTNNKDLLEACDYNLHQHSDQLIVSMFYGGQRMKQWKKYVKPYITPLLFVEQLMNSFEYGSVGDGENIQIQKLNNNQFKLIFENDEQKKKFHKMLEEADELLDFSINEEFQSNVWTITVK